jgi:hypothetical protein
MEFDRASAAQLLEHDWLKVKAHDASYKEDEYGGAVASHPQQMLDWCAGDAAAGAADEVALVLDGTLLKQPGEGDGM